MAGAVTMEHKRAHVAVEVKDAAEGSVQAVLATYDTRDLDGDVVRPGAIADGTKVLISQWQHGSWEAGRLPVGAGVLHSTPTELQLHGQFFMTTEAGRETFEVVKQLASHGLGEWSWSLRNVVAKAIQMPDGRPAREITSVMVNEASPVLVAASIGSRTLSAKDQSTQDAFEREYARFVFLEAREHLAGYVDPGRAELERIARTVGAMR